MSRRHRLNLAIVTVFGAIAFLMYTGITNATVPYYSVDQLVAAGDRLNGTTVQVEGAVDGDTASWDAETQLFTFAILGHQGQRVQVSYHGVRPDVFGNDIEAIVAGFYEDGHIEADQLLVRCPSKYKKADDAEFVDIDDWEPTEYDAPEDSQRVQGAGETGY